MNKFLDNYNKLDTRDIHLYFMSLAVLAAKRSTCVRRAVGCVAVKNKRVIATGYNGTISGMTHCTNDTCYRKVNNIPSGEKLDMCYAVHAEQNVICQAAMSGQSIEGSDIYITTTPCTTCLKLLAQVGVKNIYCLEDSYPFSDIAKNICRSAGICIITDYYKPYLN